MQRLNLRGLLPSISLTAGLLLAGCNATPTSYEQWKKEQADRARYSAAGVPYKSPSQLRAEAEEMRRVTEGVTFKPEKK